ncbi:MAG: type II CRISPR-associated endonuclease Cas1 [Bacilli bacterium]
MGFRQVLVTDTKYISVKNKLLEFNHEEKETVRIPIEEVAIVVIDNMELTLSVNAITKCTEENVMIVLCNQKHLPASLIMPYSGHYRQLEMTYKQLDLNTVKKQNLWRSIIKQKIRNQSRVVLYCELDNAYEKLLVLSREVARNDGTNREAVAAKLFFNVLYGNDFIRFKEDKINSCLNYGYAILVSSITRELISYGIDPKFGIWHSSKSNALNLSYDLVETFRPIVDYYVKSNYELINDELTPNNKRGLVSLLNATVKVDDEKMRLQNAIEKFCASFMNVIDGKETELLEIEILKVNFYEI